VHCQAHTRHTHAHKYTLSGRHTHSVTHIQKHTNAYMYGLSTHTETQKHTHTHTITQTQTHTKKHTGSHTLTHTYIHQEFKPNSSRSHLSAGMAQATCRANHDSISCEGSLVILQSSPLSQSNQQNDGQKGVFSSPSSHPSCDKLLLLWHSATNTVGSDGAFLNPRTPAFRVGGRKSPSFLAAFLGGTPPFCLHLSEF
jgi:hypothetical protein